MKRIRIKLILPVMLCLLFILGAVYGCESGPDVTEYSFNTALAEKAEIYPISYGTAYYIAADGAASNDGLTPQTPKPFSAIKDINLQPGVSVLLRRGDKFTGQIAISNVGGGDNNPITVASYGEGEKPIIEYAGDPVTFSKCSNLVIRDLQINVIGEDRTENLATPRTGIKGLYNYVSTAKYRNIYIVNNTVRGGGIAKNIMGISVTNVEMSFASSPSDVITGLYICGNEISDIGRSGIHCGSWLTNSPNNGNNGKMTVFKDVHFDGNIVYNVGMMGIYTISTTNGTINRNLVYNTGMHDRKQTGGEGMCGIMVLCSDSIDIMFNVSYNNYDAEAGNDAMAIDIDWNTKNINVQYNHVFNNEGNGIGTMACQDSYIRNNRVENNDCATNQTAQIQASDFTSRYDAVAQNMHATRNLKIYDNLIIGTPDGKSMFRAQKFNGDPDWRGNEFIGNRVVYNGDDPNKIQYVFVDGEADWYKFANNLYFANDTSVFKCFDNTPISGINIDEGAEPYQYSKNFSSWAKRDTGSTLSKLTGAIPGKPSRPNVTYENGMLNITWKKPGGDVWQYNIFSAPLSGEFDYRNMLGQTKSASFSFSPQYKGVYRIIIRPESSEGVYGEDLILTIELN